MIKVVILLGLLFLCYRIKVSKKNADYLKQTFEAQVSYILLIQLGVKPIRAIKDAFRYLDTKDFKKSFKGEVTYFQKHKNRYCVAFYEILLESLDHQKSTKGMLGSLESIEYLKMNMSEKTLSSKMGLLSIYTGMLLLSYLVTTISFFINMIGG